jgi:ABC-2 type transport system ATP-binding protein
MCLLISSHELEELEKLTNHVAIMSHGRIAAVGAVGEIRELLDAHPLSIRIDCDRNRELASALVELSGVSGLDMDGDDSLIVRARQPKAFFAQLAKIVVGEGFAVRRLQTLDESTQAVLSYILGGR